MEAPVQTAHLPGEPRGSEAMLVRAIDGLSGLAGSLGVLAVLAMTGIVCFEIVSRYLFNAPTYWVTETATYLFVGLIFIGLPAAQKAGSHIQVELLVGSLRRELRDRLELVTHWLGLLFVLVTAWQMVAFNALEYLHDTRDWGLLGTPLWIPELPISVGLILFALAILADIYRLQPPADALRRWLPVVAILALAIVLYSLGSSMAPITGTRLDWGTVAIVAMLVISMLAWSGLRTTLAVIALCALLSLAFWLARGLPLLPVGVLLVATMLLLLLLGVRIGLALGIVGLLGLYFLLPQPQLSLLAERSWSSANVSTLTAVPMFVLMGGLLARSGVTTDLFDALVRWFGRTPGGLAHASVGASAIFAAVSGSSMATAAALGSVACPEMIGRGYSPRLTYGVVAAGATLGILIPPSIAMIIYGSTVGAPVTVLFIAGIVPGLMLTVLFMTGVFVWSVLAEGAAPSGSAYSWQDKLRALVGILPFSIVILAVLGSLYAGIATPTEAGGVGAAVALLLCLLRRKLTWTALYEVALETVRITSFLMLIVVAAAIFSWVFDFLRIPRSLVEFVKAAELAPWLIMLVIGLIYIVLGMFIESISMMLMTLPVTFPIVMALGFDPIWFGIVLVLLIEVGLITPPVGIILFVLRGFSGKVPLREIVYGVLPFVAIILGFLVFLYLFPEVVSWLPSQME